MALSVVPLASVSTVAIAAFNARIAPAGPAAVVRLPDQATPRPGFEWWGVVDEEGEVRGGAMIQLVQARLPSGTVAVGCLQSPTTEGVVDSRFAMAAPLLLRSLEARYGPLYAVGMGGVHHPLPRLLRAMRWTVELVPFGFRVLRPAEFLRELPAIQTRSVLRVAAKALCATGLAGPVLSLHQGIRLTDGITSQRLDDWEAPSEALWEAMCARPNGGVSFGVLRTATELARRVPLGDPHVHAELVSSDGRAVGWFALWRTRRPQHPNFGGLAISTLLDVVASPGDEATVLRAAARRARQLGDALIIANLTHARWASAYGAAGFLRQSSNFVFAGSPQLMAAAGPDAVASIHVTRADGDGRVNL
jgi:hypothetical protein